MMFAAESIGKRSPTVLEGGKGRTKHSIHCTMDFEPGRWGKSVDTANNAEQHYSPGKKLPLAESP